MLTLSGELRALFAMLPRTADEKQASDRVPTIGFKLWLRRAQRLGLINEGERYRFEMLPSATLAHIEKEVER